MKKTPKQDPKTVRVFTVDQLRTVRGGIGPDAERGKVIGVTKWPN